MPQALDAVSAAAIEVSQLSYSVQPHFWSRRRMLLDKIAFAVAPGEVFGFLGPNGAGKTTTIKALLGLLVPDRGVVRIHGRPARTSAARRALGFMPERAYFPDYLTAYELVLQHALLAELPWRRARQRAVSVLHEVGLEHAMHTRLGAYSKGMLQRAGLAQALVGEPQLVVLDEPMSGLDPVGRRDVRDIMLRLRAAGKTVFFSTHIIPDVELICDQVGIIVGGRIQQVGRLRELLHVQQGPVEVLVAPWSGEPASLEPWLPTRKVHGDAIALTARDEADANTLIEALCHHKITIRAVAPLQSSLEELFVRATRSS